MERVASEPEAAAEVARRCGHLPLAIRLAGARLAHRPRWRVADLAERLVAGAGPLAELTAGQRSVGQAFALSYAQVSPSAQRLFPLLGLYPTGRFDGRVAAALVDLPLADTQEQLDELVDAHLVEEVQPGRYRLHDLLRDYARLLLAGPERQTERRAAVERLLDHHLYGHVGDRPGGRGRGQSSQHPRAHAQPTRPVGWSGGRGAGVVRGEPRSAHRPGSEGRGGGLRGSCWQLARACWRLNFEGGHLDELIETHTSGLGSPSGWATRRPPPPC